MAYRYQKSATISAVRANAMRPDATCGHPHSSAIRGGSLDARVAARLARYAPEQASHGGLAAIARPLRGPVLPDPVLHAGSGLHAPGPRPGQKDPELAGAGDVPPAIATEPGLAPLAQAAERAQQQPGNQQTLQEQIEQAIARAVVRLNAARPPDDAGGETGAGRAALLDAVTGAVRACLNERLDLVDSHLADLTQTLSQHPAWNAGEELGRMDAQLGELRGMEARLASAIGACPTEERLQSLLDTAMLRTVKTLPADIEQALTAPVLRAIDAAVERIIAEATPAEPQAEVDRTADVSEALRAGIAEASAGQERSMARVENRLGALQDSVAALTAQLRAAREAAEQADRLAHANAMTVLEQQVAGRSAAASSSAGATSPDRDGSAGVFRRLPRASMLVRTPASAGPSPAEVRSRFIAAARRAGSAQGQPAPGAHAASRRPAPRPKEPGRQKLARWLHGKGLLWAAAIVVAAGAAPLLAPVLRTLPEKLFAEADMGATPAYAHPAAGASPGDLTTHYALADRLAEGVMVAAPEQTASLLEKAAARGLAPAQQRLAMLYEKGAGVEQDFRKALAWYERAATGGNVRAMHNLAVLHASGAAGQPDHVAAVRWFRKAAEHGLADSQYNLAMMLRQGLGEAASPGEAWTWFDIAARGGDMEAARRRDELAGGLTQAALARAQEASARWRPLRQDVAANDLAMQQPQRDAAVPGAAAPDDGRPATRI